MNGKIDGPSGSPGQTPVRPWRQYRAIYQSGELVGFMLEASNNWTALIEQGNRIAREEIKGWLGTIICTETSLEDLYREINLIRVTVWANQATSKDYPLRRVQTALKALEEDLPAFMTELHRLQSEATTGKTQSNCEAAIAEAESFFQAVARMRVHVPDDIPPIHHKFQAWHDDALFLGFRIQQISGGGGSLKSNSSALINFTTKALDRAIPVAASARPRKEDTVRQALASHPHRSLLGFA